MTDRDRFELEMSPGTQPPSGLGDRVLVGLALFALVGGAVIAVGNVLRDNAELAHASVAPSAAPTGTPRPRPSPEPPRVVTLEQPDVRVPSGYGQEGGFSGWIRANADIVIRASPLPDATEIGILRQGEAAYANEQGDAAGTGWLALDPPAPQGWVLSVDGEIELVRRYEQPVYPTSGYIGALVAGSDGFVAIGSPPRDDTNNYQPSYPMVSIDGAEWRAASPGTFDGQEVHAIAWGPAGWLAAGQFYGPSGTEVWIWRSAGNGLGWSPLGRMPRGLAEYASQLMASDAGYLLESWEPNRGDSTLWSSTNGLTWNEATDPAIVRSPDSNRMTVAVPAGFYSWEVGSTAVPISGAFSPDGQRWAAVEGGPLGLNPRLSGIGNRILGIDADPKTMATRVWVTSVLDNRLEWSRVPEADEAFRGGGVSQLVTDGERYFAFGWDRATDAPLVWTGDGLQWQRAELPAAFIGIPQPAAAGPGRVVVVGHRPTLRGDNPIFWHRTSGGRWIPEPEPAFDVVPDPPADACPPLPSDFLDFTVLDRAAATVCYPEVPITFRAWSVPCQGCYDPNPGVAEPAWLASPTANQLFLSPIESDAGWSMSVVLGPSLQLDRAWSRAWLELTGHFDDPAAASCHSEPTRDDLAYWSGQGWIVDQCRQTFVVTGVTFVPGP
jgi:hypothetical protein